MSDLWFEGQDKMSCKADYDRDGFAIVRGFLPSDELDELRSNLDRYIQEVLPTLPDSAAFYDAPDRPETLKQLQHMRSDSYFDAYGQNPRWRELAEELAGEPVIDQGSEWFNKPPGTDHPTPPHQDNYYFCLRPAISFTLWLALDPVDEENGCLRYVRGSHLEGIRPHNATSVLGFSQGISDYGEADEAREAKICLQPGDLVAHHCETIHRADANRSATRHRRGFVMVYRGQSCQLDQAAYERYQNSLNQQHRKMGLKYVEES